MHRGSPGSQRHHVILTERGVALAHRGNIALAAEVLGLNGSGESLEQVPRKNRIVPL